MSISIDDVLKMIKDHDVKFVDFRFTDTRGKEQHVGVPAKYVGLDKFGWPCVRWFLHRRLERHSGLGYVADAGSGDGLP